MGPSQPHQLPTELGALLRRLRRRIQFYVWSEGIAAVTIAVAIAFWGFLAIDWFFEPARPVRLAILALVATGVAAVLYRLVVRRAFVPLGDTTLALLLERRFGTFHDSLLTTVDRAERSDPGDEIEWAMVDRTSRTAVKAARDVRPGRVLNWTPLRHKMIVAVALLGSIGLLSLLAHETFGFCLQRMLLTNELWPRTTRLFVAGFPLDTRGVRREKVARDGDFKLVVKADAKLQQPPPDYVEIRYRRSDGSRGRDAMTRIGNATAEGAALQIYEYTLKNVAGDLSFDVLGGDARIDDLHLVVVERPQIVAMTLACQYPDYLERQPRQLPVAGVMAIPAGTQITLQATASKPLRKVTIEDQQQGPLTPQLGAATGSTDQFRLVLPPLDQDRTLLVTLYDQDEVASQGPYRVVLQAVPDTAPQISIRLQGISSAITPNVRIPVAGNITDDYGIARVFFDFQADQRPNQTRALTLPPGATASYAVQDALDTQQFGESQRLAPQEKLRLLIKATDRCNLGKGPNIGTSRSFVLDVVTPEHHRAQLDRRELLHRQRFETLVGELVDTRDLMTRLAKDNAPVTPRGDAPRDNATGGDATGGDSDANGSAAAGTAAPPPLAPMRRRLQTARVAQNVERSAHETVEIAAAFDDIHAELINNRIATESLKQRLKEGIADPLKAIGEQKLPAIQVKIETVQPHAFLAQADTETLRDAIAETDAVLVEMKRILRRMLELESFNEVLDLLRSIIEEQDQLNKETAKRRKAQLRSLLED
jgi:hypothetical protein